MRTEKIAVGSFKPNQTKPTNFSEAVENGSVLLVSLYYSRKKKLPGLQFIGTDRLSLLLTPLRIRWTIASKL
jgi:hypothetical protein